MITDDELRARFPGFVSIDDPAFYAGLNVKPLLDAIVGALNAGPENSHSFRASPQRIDGQSSGVHEQVCFSRIQTTDKDSGTMQSAES